MTHLFRSTAAALSILAMTSLPSCGPSVRVLRHSESLAAREAQRFADAAYVERDFKKAYTLLSPTAQAAYSLDTVEAEMAKIHPRGYPSTVRTTEYEPIPGQAAMNIFLVGEGDSEKFYYRLVMAGTKDSGYKVSGFFRGSRPYPPSQLRHSLEK